MTYPELILLALPWSSFPQSTLNTWCTHMTVSSFLKLLIMKQNPLIALTTLVRYNIHTTMIQANFKSSNCSTVCVFPSALSSYCDPSNYGWNQNALAMVSTQPAKKGSLPIKANRLWFSIIRIGSTSPLHGTNNDILLNLLEASIITDSFTTRLRFSMIR